MDWLDECSAVESMEKNDLEIEGVPCADVSDFLSPCDVIRQGGEIGRPSGSPPTTSQSADGLTPPITKGHGSKTWRRIRSDAVKYGNTGYPKEILDVDNHQSSAEQEPLDLCMWALQSVQEALEKEIQKFGEIDKEHVVPIAEAHRSDLMENVKSLEVALEETRVTIRAREYRISELELEEASLRYPVSPKEESASNNGVLSRVLMDELESAFKQRIEAEIEYLAIVRTIQKLNVNLQSQLMLLTEQEAAREQKAMLDRLSDAETKASALKKRAKELELASKGIIEVAEVLKLQKRTFKATLCFFLQLLLLVFVVWFLVSQLSPDDNDNDTVVPT